MPTPRKLIAFLTLALTSFSSISFAADGDLGPGWTQSSSSGGVTVYVPTGDNPDGVISGGPLVLTQNGKEYYAPSSSAMDKTQIDSTGRIARTLTEVTRVTRSGGSTYVYTAPATFYTEAGDASNAMWDKVKADPDSFPSLSAALTTATQPPPAAAGTVVSVNGVNRKLGSIVGGFTTSATGHPIGSYFLYSSANNTVAHAVAESGLGYVYCDIFSAPLTSDPVSEPSVNFSSLNTAVSADSASISEIDRLISENPDSFGKSYTSSAIEGITSPPIPNPVTPERIIDIYTTNGGSPGTGGPTIGSDGTPTLPGPVDIPQSDPDTGGPSSPDIYGPGYTPGFNGSPYGSGGPDGAEFGNRLSQFMTDLRGSSLFSLPTSILGNIPSSGTSAISFDGGQFGQQSFDFAAFSNQFMIIRSVLLLCFSLLSIRIVTLKR